MPIPIRPSVHPLSAPSDESGEPRILVAEDPFINSFLRAVLTRRGHKVSTGEPYQASDLVLRGDLKADVVITNTPQAFLPLAETLPLLYIAASPDPEVAMRFRKCRMLRKPFRNEELLNAVEDLTRLVVR
jgi:hypothetical protein